MVEEWHASRQLLLEGQISSDAAFLAFQAQTASTNRMRFPAEEAAVLPEVREELTPRPFCRRP